MRHRIWNSEVQLENRTDTAAEEGSRLAHQRRSRSRRTVYMTPKPSWVTKHRIERHERKRQKSEEARRVRRASYRGEHMVSGGQPSRLRSRTAARRERKLWKFHSRNMAELDALVDDLFKDVIMLSALYFADYYGRLAHMTMCRACATDIVEQRGGATRCPSTLLSSHPALPFRHLPLPLRIVSSITAARPYNFLVLPTPCSFLAAVGAKHIQN